jgi:hypothetical protein
MTASAMASGLADTYDGPRCEQCDGPCWRYKGDVWGWTCTACIERHLAEGAAKADARDRIDRQRLALKRRGNYDSPPVEDGRRGGAGPAAMCRSATPASRR